MESVESISQKIYEVIMNFAPNLIGAIVTLIVGWWIIKTLQRVIRKGFDKREMEPSLKGFLNSMIGILLKIMLLLSVVGMVGVKMTSFIAILGAAGLAVGMALSGTLQNFAGGVMILLFKPFKAGDFIESQGHWVR